MEGQQQLQIHQEERQLQTWTPEQCFDACRAVLNKPPTFVSGRSLSRAITRCTRAARLFLMIDPHATPRLFSPPLQVINIYYNETLGEQVCTCCRVCEVRSLNTRR